MTRTLCRRGLAVAVASVLVVSGCAGESSPGANSVESPTSSATVATTPPATDDKTPMVLPDAVVVESGTSGVMEQARLELRSVLLGVAVDRASSALEAAGWEVRIVSEDGVSATISMDETFDRANLTIVDGLVTDVRLG